MPDTPKVPMSVAPVLQWLDKQQHTPMREEREFTWSDATLTIQVHPHGRVEIHKIYNLPHVGNDGISLPQHRRGRFREMMQRIESLPWVKEIWFAKVVGERLRKEILPRHGYRRHGEDFGKVLRGDPDTERDALRKQSEYEHRPIKLHIGLSASYWPAGLSVSDIEAVASKLKSQMDGQFSDTRTELEPVGDCETHISISSSSLTQRLFRKLRTWRVEFFFKRAKSVALEQRLSRGERNR